MEDDKLSLFKNKRLLWGLIISSAIIALLGFWLWQISKPSQPKVEAETPDDIAPGANSSPIATASITNLAINTFELKQGATVCQENGRPVVYLFSTASCPHCVWIKETFDRLAREYIGAGKIYAHHIDVETGDDLLTPDKETQLTAEANRAYVEFSPEGYIPTFVFGCKYFRIGNGYEGENDLAKEEAELRAVIEDIINNK